MIRNGSESVLKLKQAYVFEGPKPQLNEISAKITEICSLPVVISGADTEDALKFYSAEIAFECLPKVTLNIFSSKPMHGCAFYSESSKEDENEGLAASEIDWDKAVSLTANYTESTLLWTTFLALEELGGILDRDRPVNDKMHEFYQEKREQYHRQISEAELLKRHRNAVLSNWKLTLICMIYLPLQLLCWPFIEMWEVFCSLRGKQTSTES